MKNGNHNDTIFFGNIKDLMGETAEKSAPDCLVDDRILIGVAEYALKCGICCENKF